MLIGSDLRQVEPNPYPKARPMHQIPAPPPRAYRPDIVLIAIACAAPARIVHALVTAKEDGLHYQRQHFARHLLVVLYSN